jgi:hypothetical protein
MSIAQAPFPTALERAFAIARSGRALNVTEIRKTLKREGYVMTQITGASLSRQLHQIIRQSRQATDTIEREETPS